MVFTQSHVPLITVAHALTVQELSQIGHDLLQLHVGLVVVKGHDWDTVLRLEAVTIGGLHRAKSTLSIRSRLDKSRLWENTRKSLT